MTSDASFDNSKTLSEETREAIAEACARHDFPLDDATLEGEILRLAPTSLEDVPGGRELEAIADELDEFRYVAVAVPTSESEEES